MENKQKQANDFSVPRQMSKSALVVICYNKLQQLSSLFFLIAVLNLSNPEKHTPFLEIFFKLLLLLGGLVILAIVLGYLNYHFKRFYVKDGNLVFTHGILHRQATSIPVYKIHSMRTKRGLIYRLLDMKGVSFDTLASKEAEIELILDDNDWKALLRLVETEESTITDSKELQKHDTQQAIISEQENRVEIKTDTDKGDHTQLLNFSNLNLIKGAFCQNHLKGMAVFGSAILAFYGKFSEVGDEAITYAVNFLETNVPQPSFSLPVFLTFLTALYFLVMILWIGKVYLRYFNMEVNINKTQLFFESGLFTRLSSQFSYDKVCTVYVKQNILEKWMNCCTLNLKQAFNATNDKNESDVKIYGSNSKGHFLDWWLGKNFTSSKDIISAHSGKGVLGFTIRFDLVISLSALIALGYFDLYTWMFVPVCYILISLIKGLFAVRRSSICLKEDYLIVNNGKFADIQNYIKYSNIEVVRLVQTPFTPYFHRVNMIISTNGTSFVVRSLKKQEAQDIYELLLCFCRNEKTDV